jgi:hypothetical protein
MNETILRQRRALRRAVVRSVIAVAMCAFAAPFAVSAQATAKGASQSKGEFPSLMFAPQALYGAPLDGAVGAALFVPTKPWRCEDGFCGAPAVEVQAMAGIGGWRVGGGIATIGFPFWADALVTITRTGSTPRRASSESTYLGGETGFSFPIYVKNRSFVSVHPSIGIARRIDGAGASADRTNFTWNIGAVFMLPKF